MSQVTGVERLFDIPAGHLILGIGNVISTGIGLALCQVKDSLPTRAIHWICFLPGALFLVALFGWSSTSLFAQALSCYVLLKVWPVGTRHIPVVLTNFAFLARLHYHALNHPTQGVDIDLAAPMMILTQKIASLVFSLRDGRRLQHRRKQLDQSETAGHPENRIQEEQDRLAVPPEDEPDIESYLGFIFNVFGVLVGPLLFYHEYLNWVKQVNKNCYTSQKRELVKLLAATLAQFTVFVQITSRFPAEKNADPNEFSTWSYPYRLCYMLASMHFCRYKYYFAWTLGELVMTSAGIGYDEETGKWGMLHNVDYWSLELATSPKSYIDAWNKRTNLWLRHLAYSRLPSSLATVGTFILSAFWHGFFPGYYFTFLFAFPMTLAARKLRRLVRPHFQTTRRRRFVYEVATWIGTQTILAYLVVPFALLHWQPAITFYWRNQYCLLHLVVLAVVLCPSSLINRLMAPLRVKNTVQHETCASAATQ